MSNSDGNSLLENSHLTYAQQQAIYLLCQNRTTAQVAEELNVTQRTIFRWMSLAEFKSELELAQIAMIGEMTQRLVTIQGSVLDRLHYLMDNSYDQRIQLDAAKVLSSYLLEWYRLNQVSSKLIKLERIADGLDN